MAGPDRVRCTRRLRAAVRGLQCGAAFGLVAGPVFKTGVGR